MKIQPQPVSSISVIVPNWNGKDFIGRCLDSLLAQSLPAQIIVIENGSKDGSLEYLRKNYPSVALIIHRRNRGFAGGVNAGIRLAFEANACFVALCNNDAVFDRDWLKKLVTNLQHNDDAGIVTGKLLDEHGQHIDSTGEAYTTWGLPFPRGRGEPVSDHYDDRVQIFAASGGASLYRVAMLKEIGLFDEDFFAYYEDVDISFRAQLAGWKVRYVPDSLAYHQIGATSSKIKGFTTYQTIKNLPWILLKNAPFTVFWRVLPRFLLAYFWFIIAGAWRDQGWEVMKGVWKMWILLPKKLVQRIIIQHRRTVPARYIWASMTHELPPNARRLRLLTHPIKTLRNRYK